MNLVNCVEKKEKDFYRLILPTAPSIKRRNWINQVRTHAVFETEPVEAYQIQSKGKLVFHRYGDKYFLYEVWAPGLETGRELPTSREERYVKREMAQNENATKSETVSIALN